jgi:cholest-4-en-3-one 26-monooxygenase
MINMDAPKHTKLRLIVNRGFTPRQVARIEESVRAQAKEIVDHVVTLGGECDFVSEIAAALPLQIICDMMGIPRADNRRIFELTNTILGVGDPEYVQSMEELMAAGMELFQYGLALAQDRLDNPRDDIATTLMQAEVEDEDGLHRLTPGELGSFFLLLVVAGNETTRNAISGAALVFSEQPGKWEQLRACPELLPETVEEVLRWVSPITHFARVATEDCELRGQRIRAGDPVALYFASANRDEDVFDEPFAFRIDRSPNPHLAFGFGEHFCMGANLARVELEVMLRLLLARLDFFELSGRVERLRSTINGSIKHLPIRYRSA